MHTLSLMDAVACEDTRHSQQLLRAWGLDTSKITWIALHQHNEAEGSNEVIDRLRQGRRVAYLSDAGAPGISDPGSRLVRLTHQAGLRVIALPGASSVITLLSASGAWLGERSEFVFQGFLPAKGLDRAHRLNQMMQDPRAQCLFEAPHRIQTLAMELSQHPLRGLTVGRELTKQFEEVAFIDNHRFPAWLSEHAHRAKGEFAMVLHEQLASNRASSVVGERELQALLPLLPLKTAVQLATELSGGSRKTLYALALELQKSRADQDLNAGAPPTT